jgi:hypothetical protein
MTNLTRAHDQLYGRSPDERFSSVSELWQHCYNVKRWSTEQWAAPAELVINPTDSEIQATIQEKSFSFTDWSFGQLCSLAKVSKDTINKLTHDTASRALTETLPRTNKPIQFLTMGDHVRSIHPASYTRLYDVDLLYVLREFAVDFQPAQNAKTVDDPDTESSPATGLYCGEQDMFCFLIDPTGWIDIEGEAFAPGFFVWNSEVGRRTVGIQTFWFQKVCQNHIVWDAVDVTEFKRKHTANVGESLREITRMIEQLVNRRDERRDAFAATIAKAMKTKLGEDADEVLKTLQKHGITKTLGNEALKIAEEQGQFTIFSVVDALTRLAGQCENAGERTALDVKGSSLLALAE